MSLSQPPFLYQVYNDQNVKKLAVVFEIPGLDYLTSTTIGRQLMYGDPYVYGDPQLIYGGLVPLGLVPGETGQKVLLSLDGGSLTISQRLEPEQGRAAISTLAATFIDKDQYMTMAISPGILIPEILGQPVKVWLGYAQTSFPNDFYVVWQGVISQVNPDIGRVTIQFSDANILKRQQIFFQGQTKLSSSILAGDTTIPVISNSDFHKKILGPDGVTYDDGVKLYLKIEDEYIEYQQIGSEATGFGVNQFLGVLRGQRLTTAVAHPAAADVEVWFELSGLAVFMALKLQLSGWNGPYISNYSPTALVITGDPITPIILNAIVLPLNVDGIRDLGLTVGDYITVSGATNLSNDGLWRVIGFQDSSDGQTNKYVLMNTNFIAEGPTPALINLRSQFDTYPITFGSKLPAFMVDVSGHLFYANSYLNSLTNSYRFFLSSPESGKSFIETEIMLPLGAYCLTRQGRLSMGLTKPPIADDRTSELNASNILEPQTIKQQRGLNNRKYFNEIDWYYDYPDSGDPVSNQKDIDTASLTQIGLSSVLPIKSRGSRTDLGFNTIVTDRTRFLLLRYAKGAVLLDVKTNFGTGNLIEAGDIVILRDQGELQIPNMATGRRDYGIQLLEVINRSIDLKSGMVMLQLQGGVQSLIDDRYATISPSSDLTAASTASTIVITESYGEVYPSQEYLKWDQYIGLQVIVHSPDYTTRYEETTFTGFDPSDHHIMFLSPALSFTPLAGDVLEIAPYPTSTDHLVAAAYKLIHCFLDPSVSVTSGVSVTSFNVALIDAPKFIVGMTVIIHNTDYSILSPEVTVFSVAGTLITVDASLGFTPAAAQQAEFLGFADFNLTNASGGPYRFV